MCDTIVTIDADGVLFAKNSDRDANESQALEWVSGSRFDSGSTVRCTWIEIPQIAQTFTTMLSRPWWMWGAEMGANEHGVVIGNEAVFTNEPDGEPALLGMDLLRLALERARDARGAADTIIELLERHGQGGPCSHARPGFTYDNSYLIADATGALVLETAGRHWAVEEVGHGVRGISNALSIPGFAEQYSNRLRTTIAGGRHRRARTEASALQASGPGAMMALLRDHGPHSAPHWRRLNGTLYAPCVHAGGTLASSQTTASLVADLRGDTQLWATATSAPCTSLFKPVRVGRPVESGSVPGDAYDAESLWWRHERLHRSLLAAYPHQYPTFSEQRDAIEAAWINDAPTSEVAFGEAAAFEASWLERLRTHEVDWRPRWVQRAWRDLDVAARMPAPIN